MARLQQPTATPRFLLPLPTLSLHPAPPPRPPLRLGLGLHFVIQLRLRNFVHPNRRLSLHSLLQRFQPLRFCCHCCNRSYSHMSTRLFPVFIFIFISIFNFFIVFDYRFRSCHRFQVYCRRCHCCCCGCGCGCGSGSCFGWGGATVVGEAAFLFAEVDGRRADGSWVISAVDWMVGRIGDEMVFLSGRGSRTPDLFARFSIDWAHPNLRFAVLLSHPSLSR